MVINTKSDNRSDNSAKITHSLQAEKAAFIETISDALLQAKGITPYKSVLQMEVTDLSGNTHRIQSLLESKYIAPDVLEYIATYLIDNYPYYGIGYDTLARSVIIRNLPHHFKSSALLFDQLEAIHMKAIEPEIVTVDIPKFIYNYLLTIVLFHPDSNEFLQYLTVARFKFGESINRIDQKLLGNLEKIVDDRIRIHELTQASRSLLFGSFD